MTMAALYIRLSKEDEEKKYVEDESESIKNQRLLLLQYASAHGYQVYNIYIDEDFSGLYDTKRPAFYQMLKDAREGKFDTILCKSQNRFSRNMEHIEKYLHKELPLLGIRFIGVVDGTDTAFSSGKKARQINGLVNEWYCEDLSENIKAVLQKKMEDGQYISAFAAYGYKKDESDHHKIVIDKNAAGIVTYIYQLYLAGNGIGKIAKILTSKQIPTPLQYKQMQGLNYQTPNSYYSKSGLWSISTIKRILSNPIYIGTLIQGRERKVSYKDKKVVLLPKEQWHVIEDNHEPIISREMFDQVQSLLKQRRKSFSKEGQQKKEPNVFAGKLVCGECKKSMYKASTSRNKGYYYYMCQLYKRSNGKECARNSIRSDELEQIVLENINALIKHYLTKNERQVLQGNFHRKDMKKADMGRLINEKEHILKAMSTLYIDFSKGIVTKNDRIEIQELLYKSLKQTEKEITELAATKNEKEEEKKKELEIKKLDYYLIQSLIQTIEISVKEDSGKVKLVFFWNI
ncbi:MAG: recombinase family protein [bacterium]|nr:recombinase family protein [bacterium]